MRIEVIDPHGFCGGVERALKMSKDALASNPRPVYCLHEIVHNEMVVGELSDMGLLFVDEIDDVPDGAMVVISAHGTSPATYASAKLRRLNVIDATCPFVSAAHAKIRENFANGMRTVVIGVPTHVEVRGYLGEQGACLPEDVRPGEKTGIVVQTTLDAERHDGVCTATRDRQHAVRRFVETNLASGTAVGVLVVGSGKSSNTQRLVEIAKGAGAQAWRVCSPDEVERKHFDGIEVLGVTSGASTPETLFREVLSSLSMCCGDVV